MHGPATTSCELGSPRSLTAFLNFDNSPDRRMTLFVQTIVSCNITAMASRTLSKDLRSPLAKQLSSPAAQRRTFIAIANVARPMAAKAVKGQQQQVRGVKQVSFAGVEETVYGKLLPYQCIEFQVTKYYRTCRLAKPTSASKKV